LFKYAILKFASKLKKAIVSNDSCKTLYRDDKSTQILVFYIFNLIIHIIITNKVQLLERCCQFLLRLA